MRIVLQDTGLHVTDSYEHTGIRECIGIGGTDKMIWLSVVTEAAELAFSPTLRDNTISLKLEHQKFAWVTEEDIRNDVFRLMWGVQKETLLQGFRLRRGLVNRRRHKVSAVRAVNSMPIQGTWIGQDTKGIDCTWSKTRRR